MISSLFPEARILSDIEQLKEEIGRDGYDVIHIPCGCFMVDSESPWRSAFHADGTLSVADMAEVGVETDLLVFSGSLCGEAGPGFRVAVEALLSSGINSLVLPLWIMNDKAAFLLMEEMYRGLFRGLPKGEALRQAKLSFLKDETRLYRHPYFWAGFVLYGDWRGGVALETGKIDYGLYQKLLEWRANPTVEPPVVEVLLTLKWPAKEADLEVLRSLSPKLEVLGAYGSFVVLRIPLPLLEELAELAQVRSISEVPETIP